MQPEFIKKIKDKNYIERCKKLFDVVVENVAHIEPLALFKSIEELRQSLKDHQGDEVEDVLDKHPIIFLNDHGKGHIECVLERADNLIKLMDGDSLSSYECYILYCAILVHDVGILEGREGHTNRVKQFLYSNCATILKDSFEREYISKIASAHGGSINGDKDTIGALPIKMALKNNEIHARLLAAILRFADELADDSSRQILDPKFLNSIPPESLIYHYYSKCLHSVQIKTDGYTKYIELTYALTVEDALKVFKGFNQERYLLDEIFSKTLKMETERRYCNKFFSPKLFIDRIEVQINIFDEINCRTDLPCIKYMLEEKGYPLRPQLEKIAWTGKSLKDFLEKKEGEK